jgi:hypothetical protein
MSLLTTHLVLLARVGDSPLQSCSLLVCMGTQCNVFNVAIGGFVQYSFLGPVPDGSTSMTISVSADVASTCTSQKLLFDDFTLE